MITVYTKPGCVGCDATKRQLDKLGVEYTAVDVTEHPDAALEVTALGYTSVPVVVVDAETHWSGLRPDRLKALA